MGLEAKISVASGTQVYNFPMLLSTGRSERLCERSFACSFGASSAGTAILPTSRRRQRRPC